MQQTLNPDDLAQRPEPQQIPAMSLDERLKLANIIRGMQQGQNMQIGNSRITMGPNGPVPMQASSPFGYQPPGFR